MNMDATKFRKTFAITILLRPFSHTLYVSTIRIIIIKQDINYFSNEAPTTFGNKEDYADEEVWYLRTCCSFWYV